jgi:hypothetical protein
MDLKLHLLDTFRASGSDGNDYKVCAYERLRRDDSLPDGLDHWVSTGVTEYRLDSGEEIDARADDHLVVRRSGIALTKH